MASSGFASPAATAFLATHRIACSYSSLKERGRALLGGRHPQTPLADQIAAIPSPLCVSYELSKMYTIDQEITDLRFALRCPVSCPSTRSAVLDLTEAKGFTLNREYGLGCWRWYYFNRM